MTTAHRIHLILACAFLFALPLSTAAGSICFSVLGVWWLIRLPKTHPSLPVLLRHPVMWSMLAWVAWSLLSTLWSKDQAMGLDHAGAMRVAMVPVLLWSVAAHAPVLLASFLLGVAAQNGWQLYEVAGHLLRHDVQARAGGPLDHAGQAGLFCALAIVGWLSVAAHHNERLRGYMITGLVLAAAGLLAARGRASWIAAVVGGLAVAVIAVQVGAARWQRTAIMLAVVGLCLLGTGVAMGRPVLRWVSDVPASIAKYDDQSPKTGVQWRLTWWKQSLDAWKRRPLTGHGLGSFGNLEASQVASKGAAHPHSAFVQSAAEGGLVGLMLFAGMLASIAWCGCRSATHMLAKVAVPSAVIAWATAACFDGLQTSGTMLSALMVVAFFAMLPSSGPDP